MQFIKDNKNLLLAVDNAYNALANGEMLHFVEKEELHYPKYFSFMMQMSDLLISSAHYEVKVSKALQLLGDFIEPRSIEFFALVKNEFHLTVHWTKTKILKFEELKTVLSFNDYPSFKQILKDDIFLITVNKGLPKDLLLYLERTSGQSALIVPLKYDDELLGFLSIDGLSLNHSWNKLEHLMAKRVADMISGLMHNYSASRRAQEAIVNQKLLFELSEIVNLESDINIQLQRITEKIDIGFSGIEIIVKSEYIFHQKKALKTVHLGIPSKDEKQELSYPLIGQKNRWGDVIFRLSHFSETDFHLFANISQIISSVIAKHNRLRELQRNQMIIEDINNRLKKREEFLDRMLTTLPIGVLVLRKRIIEYAAGSIKNTSGFEPLELQGKAISDFFYNGDIEPDKLAQFYRNIGIKGIASIEVVVRRKNGRPLELYVQGTKAPEPFDPECVLIIGQDVTSLKETERALLQSKYKAEEADRLKSAFLANISHEVRTPLNAIVGFSNLLRDPENSKEEQLSFINIINQNADNLVNLITDIVELSKIESGQIPIHYSSISINTILERIYNLFKNQVDNNKIEFLLHLDLSRNEAVMDCDALRLTQILHNLVANAIKFTVSGFIELGYKDLGDAIRFYVKDSGIGIASDKRKIIFEAFRQENETTSRKYGGTGLGLAISKRMVERLNGKLQVISQKEKGSEFYFEIPKKVKY